MAPVARTKYLDRIVESAAKTAAEKYADASQFANYIFSSHPEQHQAPGAGTGFAETVRHMAFGDPLTLHKEMQTGVGHAIKRTLVPEGKLNLGLTYGLPAALTAMQYASTPEEERPHVRGSLAGGAIGGMLGSQIGNRFGVAGQMLLSPTLARAGQWVGSHFDKKREEPGHYQVKTHRIGATVVPTIPPNEPPIT